MPLSRKRFNRKRAVRSRAINISRLSMREIALGREMYPEAPYLERPQTRAECREMTRPCPYAGCAHHLYLDVLEKTGAIRLNFPDLEPDELQHSCALDIADRGGSTLEFVGDAMNITRERVRQLEVVVFKKLRLPMASLT